MAMPIVLVNVPADHETNKLSFEELRIQDYIQAYTKTGRPPIPVPQEPADEQQRLALGLPPLWKSYVENEAGASTGPAAPNASGPGGDAVRPEALPEIQTWEEVQLMGEKYQGITMRSPYNQFSFEELRYYACLRGKGHHYEASTSTTQTPQLGTTPALLPPVSKLDTAERFENISARAGFEGHSPEEHRISYLLTGQELTSEEIFRRSAGANSQPVAPSLSPVQSSISSSSNPLMKSTPLGNPLAPSPTLRRIW